MSNEEKQTIKEITDLLSGELDVLENAISDKNEEREYQPEIVLTSATVTCTCTVDEEGNLTIDKECYWHGK